MLQGFPSLQEPDKLGMLIQIRQSMDVINTNQLIPCSKLIIDILTADQLKSLLFVGMDHLRHQLEYPQLFSIKHVFKSAIDNNKKKANKNTNNHCFELNISPKVNVEKDASLSTTIPTHIVTNYICSFLDLLSIYEFSKCDRNIAVICRTPLSIYNLQFNYLNPYRYCRTSSIYCLDSDHLSQNEDVHLIRNVSRLSIIRDSDNTPIVVEKLQYLTNIKHLTIYQELLECEDDEFNAICDMDFLNDWRCVQHNWPFMTLASITFESNYDLPFILYMLSQYTNTKQDTIKSISFLNCHLYSLETYGQRVGRFEDDSDDDHFNDFIGLDMSQLNIFDEYQNILELLLPSTSNNIHVLKFDKSYFLPSEHAECQKINEKFNNMERICASLSNLKGIVFSELNHDEAEIDIGNNIFYQITSKILCNISLFKQLKSVHVHTEYVTNDLALLLMDPSINNNMDAFSQIEELCISIGISDEGIGLMNNLKHLVKTGAFNITKLCFVIEISSEINVKWTDILMETMKEILCKCKQLELFQIVFEIHNTDYYSQNSNSNENICEQCITKLDVIHNIFKHFDKMFVDASYESNRFATKRLTSKFHIKCSHYYSDAPCDILQTEYKREYMYNLTKTLKIMTVNYLSVFFKGKLQFKLTWNIKSIVYWNFFKHLLPLETIFDVQHCEKGIYGIKIQGPLQQSMDHMKQSICIQNKLNDMKVQTNPLWSTDCTYCDNTQWL